MSSIKNILFMIPPSKELFSKKIFIVFALLFLLSFQLIYGFLFSSVGSSGTWHPIEDFLPKSTSQSFGNILLDKIFPLISSRYSLHSDALLYLELGRDFSAEAYRGHAFTERPLWPFLIFLSSKFISLFISVSDALIFGLAMLLNFILAGTAVLLFFLLIEKLISLKTAWLSSILLIFSPFVHTFLNQPMAETLMLFIVVFSVFLLYHYLKKPSILKLIVFSLIFGILMLGKMFFAITFFILLLSFYFRRYKEGIIFLMLQPIPLLLWYLWVTKIWQISYYALAIGPRYKMGVWVFDIIQMPWQQTSRFFLSAFPSFIIALAYSFFLIPIFFSMIGFQKLPFKSKNLIYFGSIFSLAAFFFLIRLYAFRHAFLLFPIIYPTCVLGIDRIAEFFKKKASWLAPVFYATIIGLIIFVSSINVYQIFDYSQEIPFPIRLF